MKKGCFLGLVLILVLFFISSAGGEKGDSSGAEEFKLVSAGNTVISTREKKEIWTLSGEVIYLQGKTLFKADKVTYNKTEGSVAAEGHVSIIDDSLGFRLLGEKVDYDVKTKYALSPQRAQLQITAGDKTTTRIESDRLEAWLLEKKARASGKVTIQKENLLAQGELLEYTGEEEKATLDGSPSLIQGDNRLFARRFIFGLGKESKFVAEGFCRGHYYPRREEKITLDTLVFPLQGLIIVEANQGEYFPGQGITRFQGNVKLSQGEMDMQAEMVEIQLEDGIIRAEDKVGLNDRHNGIAISAQSLYYRQQERIVSLEGNPAVNWSMEDGSQTTIKSQRMDFFTAEKKMVGEKDVQINNAQKNLSISGEYVEYFPSQEFAKVMPVTQFLMMGPEGTPISGNAEILEVSLKEKKIWGKNKIYIEVKDKGWELEGEGMEYDVNQDYGLVRSKPQLKIVSEDTLTTIVSDEMEFSIKSPRVVAKSRVLAVNTTRGIILSSGYLEWNSPGVITANQSPRLTLIMKDNSRTLVESEEMEVRLPDNHTIAKGNVSVVNKEKLLEVSGGEMDYSPERGSVKLVQDVHLKMGMGDGSLTAAVCQEVELFVETRDLIARENVFVENPKNQVELVSDYLQYQDNSGRLFLTGHPRASVGGESSLISLQGEEIEGFLTPPRFYVRGNVRGGETARQVNFWSDTLEYQGGQELISLQGRANLEGKDPRGETLLITGDRIEIFLREENLMAYQDVKITKKDVVGKADLLIYYNLDEKAILTGHSCLWRNQDYFQADKIMVYLGQVSSVVLEGKAEGKYFYKL